MLIILTFIYSIIHRSLSAGAVFLARALVVLRRRPRCVSRGRAPHSFLMRAFGVMNSKARTSNNDTLEPDVKSVLVVEDHRPNRILIEMLLTGLGCTPHLAVSGAKALEISACQTFDLILMDIRMPRMNGIETLRRLRDSGGPNSLTPVVALTANTAKSDHRDFQEAGVAAILVKPVSPASLAAVINQCTRLCTPDPAISPSAA